MCVSSCPSNIVDGEKGIRHNNPDDKASMICMASTLYSKYTQADEAGITDFATMTPAEAIKYGVCNYKYRTAQLANRCYFIDKVPAHYFTYHLPNDYVAIFAQVFIFDFFFFLIFLTHATINNPYRVFSQALR